jgi:16S rRNA U1498 N3-methylase RsmE
MVAARGAFRAVAVVPRALGHVTRKVAKAIAHFDGETVRDAVVATVPAVPCTLLAKTARVAVPVPDVIRKTIRHAVALAVSAIVLTLGRFSAALMTKAVAHKFVETPCIAKP